MESISKFQRCRAVNSGDLRNERMQLSEITVLEKNDVKVCQYFNNELYNNILT